WNGSNAAARMDTVIAHIETVRLDTGRNGMAAKKDTRGMRVAGDGNSGDSKPLGASAQAPGRMSRPLIAIVALLAVAGVYYWLSQRPTAPDVALDRQDGLALYRQG